MSKLFSPLHLRSTMFKNRIFVFPDVPIFQRRGDADGLAIWCIWAAAPWVERTLVIGGGDGGFTGGEDFAVG